MPDIIPVGLKIDASGAKAGADEFNSALATVDRKTTETAGFIQKLEGALGGFGQIFAVMAAGLAVGKLIEAADSFTLLKTRLDASTGSTEKGTEALGFIREAAESAHVSVKALAQSYSDGARVLQEKGMTIQQSVETFGLMAKVLRANGNSAQDAEQGMDEFARGVNNGRLAVRQFQDLMEKTPTLARMLQKELGATSMELRKMAEAGMISGNTIAVVLRKNADDISSDFKKVPRTVGEAWDELTGKLGKIGVGAFIESGISKPLIDAIDWLRGTAVEVSSLARSLVTAAKNSEAFTSFLASVKSDAATVGAALRGLYGEVKRADDYYRGFLEALKRTEAYAMAKAAIDFLRENLKGLSSEISEIKWAPDIELFPLTKARQDADKLVDIAKKVSYDIERAKPATSLADGIVKSIQNGVESAKEYLKNQGVGADIEIFDKSKIDADSQTVVGSVKAAGAAIIDVLTKVRDEGAALNASDTAAISWGNVVKILQDASVKVSDIEHASASAALEASHFHDMAKKILETETAQSDVLRAQLGANKSAILEAQEELEVRQKIPVEIRKYETALAVQIESQIRLNNSIKEQAANLAETRTAGEGFARVITDGFLNGAKAGDSFGMSVKKVAASLAEMVLKMSVIDPMVKGFGRSFADAFPDFNPTKLDAKMNGGDGASMFGDMTKSGAEFATAVDTAGTAFTTTVDTAGTGLSTLIETAATAFATTVQSAGVAFASAAAGSSVASGASSAASVMGFAAGDVFSSPVAMRTSGGQNAVMAEAGPEAVMPLQRSADGRLGVAVSGGSAQSKGHTVVMNVAGDVSQDTVDRLMSGVHRAIASAAGGIVSASVNRVAQMNRADPSYLAR